MLGNLLQTRKNKLIFISILVVIIGILSNDAQILIVPTFLLFWAFTADEFESDAELTIKNMFLYVMFLTIISGLFFEGFAVLSNLKYPPSERKLFLPDPFLDMVVSLGYYVPVALVFALYVVKFDIDIKWGFLGGGIYGIITEQTGAILLSFNLIFWIYVLIVYGSFFGIPLAIARGRLSKLKRREMRPILSLVLLVVVLLIGYIIVVHPVFLLTLIIMNIPL